MTVTTMAVAGVAEDLSFAVPIYDDSGGCRYDVHFHLQRLRDMSALHGCPIQLPRII